ncbi:MAG: hypothetical protein AB7L41_04005 [Flavobacteriaceae bacterium]
MTSRAARTALLLLVLSLATGWLLEHFDLAPDAMLGELGIAPEGGGAMSPLRLAGQALVGAFVVVPVWFLLHIFRSPR